MLLWELHKTHLMFQLVAIIPLSVVSKTNNLLSHLIFSHSWPCPSLSPRELWVISLVIDDAVAAR